MTVDSLTTRHPFLDGKPKRMFVDGKWVGAASGKTFETINPSTGANRTNYGLGSGLWTRDVTKAHKLARGIRAGSVWINCYRAMDPAVPFGGYKMSGYGRESGKQHVEEYLKRQVGVD
jgi:acyl-CoA reductase-like NAD-dependent aldehyde dehydrogenase